MKKSIYLFLLLIPLLLISCASEKSAAYAYESSSDNYRSMGNSETQKNSVKKVIYTATINLTVNDPDTANVQIGLIAKKHNGYTQQSGTTKCIIRVEEKQLKTAMDEICLLGRVESKVSYGEDVTSQYSDYAIRLENAERSRSRYLELLAKAENVEAALKVEKELERLNETIELLKGQMNRIDHLSTYSTITVYLKERKKPGILGYVGIGLYRTVKWFFVRN